MDVQPEVKATALRYPVGDVKPCAALAAKLHALLTLAFVLYSAQAQAQDAPHLVVQAGHAGFVTDVAFSPDGQLLASSGDDYTIRIWHAAGKHELRTLRGHSGSVNGISFSPDSRWVASASSDCTVKLWDVTRSEAVRTLGQGCASFTWGEDKLKVSGHTSQVHGVAFAPDGRRLVSAGAEGVLRLWDPATGAEIGVLTGHVGWVNSVAFAQGGRHIASAGEDKTVRLWDARKRKQLRVLTAHPGAVTRVAFAPDGHLVAAVGAGGLVQVWDVASGKPVAHHKESGDSSLKGLAFAPGGRRIATTTDRDVLLWDPAGGKEPTRISFGRFDGVFLVGNVAFSSNSRELVIAHGGGLISGSLAELAGRHQRTSAANADSPQLPSSSWERLRDFGAPVYALAFGKDGSQLFATWGGRWVQWDLTRGQRQRVSSPVGIASSIAVSTNSNLLATGGMNKLVLWEATTGRLLRELVAKNAYVDTVAFAPDGKSLASAGGSTADNNTGIFLWNTETPTPPVVLDAGAKAEALAFAPDGTQLLAVDSNDTITLWDVAARKPVWKSRGYHVNDVAFAPDGRTFAIASDSAVDLRDATTGKRQRYLFWGIATSVRYAPSGDSLVAANLSGEVAVIDLRGGEPRRLRGHQGAVNAAIWSPDGKVIFSGGSDGTIRAWRAVDGTPIASLIGLTNTDANKMFGVGNLDRDNSVVTDPQGRFDTQDLEQLTGLHWVLPQAPLTPVPVEAFMRDYYEPRLLPRLLAGEKLTAVRPLLSVKTVQPHVSIVQVTPDPADPLRVSVEVEVKGLGGRQGTDAHDLRLFRDGQLVGYTDGLVSSGATPARKTFSVRLPQRLADQVVFSAYAFNDDRIKSETARLSWKPRLKKAVKGRAYVVSIGVSAHENSDWDLQFGATDAKLIEQTVAARLARTGGFREVVAVALTSEEDVRNASKAKIQAVLQRLAGLPAGTELTTIAGAERLQPATPEDLVIVTFSGHGFTGDGGRFYLVPQDTGPGTGKKADKALREHSVSSDELTTWLRDLDAGELIFVVDACQSAASVGATFKPGPMGSRGLGQLAFDKGMRLLTASQADEFALESGRVRHGLLTYALVAEGLEGFRADTSPQDGRILVGEWLSYAVKRVPSLAEDIADGKPLPVGTRGAVQVFVTDDDVRRRPAQQPMLFDFAKRERQGTVLTSQ